MKLTLEELSPGTHGEYLVAEDSPHSMYDVIFLLGKKSRSVGREFHITYKTVDGGTLVKWAPMREVIYDRKKSLLTF